MYIIDIYTDTLIHSDTVGCIPPSQTASIRIESLCYKEYILYVYILDIHSDMLIHSDTVRSSDGSTHTESNKLYRKVKHRARPNRLR